MTVRVELWPVAADETGIWLLDSDAWRSDAIPADSEPHGEIELLAYRHQPTTEFPMYHSTSWRPEQTSVTLSYIGVAKLDQPLVLDQWPDAKPISAALMTAVGRPTAVQPNEAPLPRHIDVLLHGIRHLRFLMDTDEPARAILSNDWRRHLAMLEPSLSGMYRDRA
jgi:hypothetical protein